MFLLSPVGGISEREERDVTDYFQKRYRETLHAGLNFCQLVGGWSQRLAGRVCYGFIFIGEWLDRSDRRCFFLSNACNVWCVFRKRK